MAAKDFLRNLSATLLEGAVSGATGEAGALGKQVAQVRSQGNRNKAEKLAIDAQQAQLGFLLDKGKREDALRDAITLRSAKKDPLRQKQILRDRIKRKLEKDPNVDLSDTMQAFRQLNENPTRFNEGIDDLIEVGQAFGELPGLPREQFRFQNINTPQGKRAFKLGNLGSSEQLDGGVALPEDPEKFGKPTTIFQDGKQKTIRTGEFGGVQELPGVTLPTKGKIEFFNVDGQEVPFKVDENANLTQITDADIQPLVDPGEYVIETSINPETGQGRFFAFNKKDKSIHKLPEELVPEIKAGQTLKIDKDGNITMTSGGVANSAKTQGEIDLGATAKNEAGKRFAANLEAAQGVRAALDALDPSFLTREGKIKKFLAKEIDKIGLLRGFLPKKAKEELSDHEKFTTLVNTNLVTTVKAISGAQVAAQEFDRIKKISLDEELSNIQFVSRAQSILENIERANNIIVRLNEEGFDVSTNKEGEITDQNTLNEIDARFRGGIQKTFQQRSAEIIQNNPGISREQFKALLRKEGY